MTYIESIFVPWFTQLTVVFFFVSGLIALAVGVGLIACTAWTLEFAASINRWASAQSALRWVATERDVERPLQRHARVFGVVLIAGGAFVLIAGPETRGFITNFALHPVNVDWIGTAVNRVLITGNVFAIVLGIVLLLFPTSLGAIEARANRPVSSNAIDNQVRRNPQLAGWLIAAGALFIVIDFGLLLFGS